MNPPSSKFQLFIKGSQRSRSIIEIPAPIIDKSTGALLKILPTYEIWQVKVQRKKEREKKIYFIFEISEAAGIKNDNKKRYAIFKTS